MGDLFVALLHHPVLDKNGQVVTTALTNMDVHDIARTARTYGVRRFFIVHPVRTLQLLAQKILEHWETGYGSTYNLTRKDALQLVRLESDLDGAIVAIERETGRRPRLVATSARGGEGRTSFGDLRARREAEPDPFLLLLGTGWGLTPEILRRAEVFLEPIVGPGDYNHLSVRSAAAVILDRLCAPR
jgi:hypothetical protein